MGDCCPHMAGGVEQLKTDLKEGHVIHTLVSEHEMILGFLDKLEDVNAKIQKMDSFDGGREEFAVLKHAAEHLLGAEPHHKREEEILFPALEERGISGPTQMMRIEHEEFRPRKAEIKKLAEDAPKMNFGDFKKKLNDAANFLVGMLREHIFKENNILYPMALEVIEDENIWQNMKKGCDKIGYCCFTPKS